MENIKGNIVDIINRKIFYGTVSYDSAKIIEITEEDSEKADEQYILPGLIDSHVHIESSMLVPSEFARIAVVHGTVATISDPHEIANVLGMEGIKFMLDNADKVPLKFYFGAPSCVPATPFETAGAKITTENIKSLFEDKRIKYLAEMMNFPGVIYDDPEVMEKIKIAKEMGRVIDGHAPGLMGEPLKKYVSAGITTDHETFMLSEALEKISLGMKIMIRKGSAANDYKELKSLISTHSNMVMLCSDDIHPDELILGHVNKIIKLGLKDGINIFNLLTAATLNPVLHYNLEVGLLRKGDFADFIVVDDLDDFNVIKTFINGNLVAENGKSFIKKVDFEPVNIFNTLPKQKEDFAIKSDSEAKVKVIVAIDEQIVTKSSEFVLKSNDGYLKTDLENDILKISVVNRYVDTPPAVAFIKNFGLMKGAIASSIAHDSHNIIAVGTTDEELCQAVNALIEAKGGIAVVYDGIQKVLPLPIAGLMTNEDYDKVAKEYSEINKIVKSLGCKLKAPFMTLSFMALLVIPELKLSDKGLFDGVKFEFTNLFV
ncbi:MAG: adenine deaminase [Ignavibacteria bacterium]|nr:adenine deaminase [Ignavibacteria bacterium]